MTQKYAVRRTEVHHVRENLITQAQNAKSVLIGDLNAGDRDYARLRDRLDQYIEALKGADVLNGYAEMEDTGT